MNLNILHVALLLPIIYHVLASEDIAAGLNGQENSLEQGYNYQRFQKAIRENNIENVYKIFIFNSEDIELRKYCVDSLIKLKGLKIVGLIKDAKEDVKAWVLQIVLSQGDQLLIEEVLGKLNISNELLTDLVIDANVACIPDRFIHVLRRITDKESQQEAIEKGIFGLYHGGRIECIEPLLSAL